jgi:outer membrane protein, heavy metal efflux system
MHHLLTQRLSFIARSSIISLLCVSMQGCVQHSYKEEPINTGSVLNEINSWSVGDFGLNQFLQINGVSDELLNSNTFSIKRLYLTSLYYEPEMQVAYKRWKKAQIITKHSDYKINPELSIPFEHHSETSSGQSEWTIGVVLSFIYERKGKREARQAKAEVELLNAKLVMKKLVFDRYGDFEETYHDYLLARAKIVETENEVDVLKELSEQLQKKYELGAVSQFELSTTKLELQQRLFQLTLLRNSLQENVDDLLAMTHLIHSELDDIELEYVSPFLFTKKAYQETELMEAGFSRLQKEMLGSHIEMAVRLNEYALSEAELKLEIENQYPDLVLSPGFIFDQSDNIWALGASWILPLFKNTEQNLNILKALEERKIKQQEITVLQKELLNSLYKRHKSVVRHKALIKVSDEIIESIEQRASEIEKQIEIGGIDSVALLRNRIEFYQARQTQIDVYKEAVNALLEFEHLLQSSHSEMDINNIMASWLELREENNNEVVN